MSSDTIGYQGRETGSLLSKARIFYEDVTLSQNLCRKDFNHLMRETDLARFIKNVLLMILLMLMRNYVIA